MEKLFAISIIGLFSLLILNVTLIVKNDINETKKEELNQKIENSIIHPSNYQNIKSLKLKHEKELNHKLLLQKALFV